MIPVAKPYLGEEEAKLAYETILSGWVTQGPKVELFENNFAAYVGAKYAVAVSNCTTALHLAMIVAGVEEGDEVICPSLSYVATANAVRYVKANPVFAEVDPTTYNIDIDHVKKLITSKTKAILIVHQIGMPADIDVFKDLCHEKNLILIEDAACASGSSYKGGKVGSHSDLVCFSFHPRKVITTGEGGMICTSNEQYAKRLKLLRQHGMSVNDRVRHSSSTVIITDHVEVGYNYRMTDIQAAVGIKQLEKLDWIVAERRKIALHYHESLKDIPFIRLPVEAPGYYSNYQSYSIYLKKDCPISRDELMQKLLDEGIATRSGIMTAHRETAYRDYCKDLQLPISEDACDRSILLPLFIPLEKKDLDFVILKLRHFLGYN
ncbi:MAG TPA: DegT/DnrJ/EryC1/StrS family aminotransferase [Cyclobacteriaceae bacterium]